MARRSRPKAHNKMAFISLVLVALYLIKIRWPRGCSVYNKVETRYGHDAVNVLRMYERNLKKFNRLQLDIKFLNSCKLFNITPNFLQFKLCKPELHSTRMCKQLKQELLDHEIIGKTKLRSRTKDIYETCRSRLQAVLSPLDFSVISHRIECKVMRHTNQVKIKQDRKLTRLKERKGIFTAHCINKDHVIFNYSHRQLSVAEENVLSRGLKFCLPPKSINKYDIFSNFEQFYDEIQKLEMNISPENTDRLRTKLKDLSYSYMYSYNHKMHKNILSQDEWSALNDLRNDQSIIITRPDKGNAVVILKRDDYLRKMNQLINDPTKFKKLDSNLTKSRETKLTNYLLKLKNKQIISEDTYFKLRPVGSQPAILYGLPKVHKDGCPMRPIMSSMTSYNYKLAKYLVELLKPLTTNQHTVTDTFSFVNWIQQHKGTNHHMASYDVSSLFTNIPLKETIDICIHKLYNSNSPPALPKAVFKELLIFATKSSHFKFNNQYYDQIDGVAMGSPLGPVLANVFMCDFEEKFVDTNKTVNKPLVWKRYVDDVFCTFNNPVDAQQFLVLINKCHPNIKFTYESEINSELSFLDVLIKRENNKFVTTVYKKPTFTGLYTKWDSFTPRRYKINLVRTLTHRYVKICSPQFLEQEIEKLRINLLINGYPKGVLNFHIKDTIQKSKVEKPIQTGPNKKEIKLILPYTGENSSNLLKNNLIRTVNRFYKCLNVKVVFTSNCSIKSFFPYKDTVSRSQKSFVVYKANCWDCNATYIGKTKKRLHDRKTEHFNGMSDPEKESAVSKHTLDTGHNINWDQWKILATGKTNKDILIKEKLLIRDNKPSLNDTEGSVTLKLF